MVGVQAVCGGHRVAEAVEQRGAVCVVRGPQLLHHLGAEIPVRSRRGQGDVEHRARRPAQRAGGQAGAQVGRRGAGRDGRCAQRCGEVRERRGGGALVNIASSVSYIATPWLAPYGASKAFLLSFTEALLGERPSSGVQILAVCPAGMNTGFRAASGLRDTPNPLSPDAVARRTLDLIEAGRSGVFNLGLGTLVFRMVGLLPPPLRIVVCRRLMEQGL